MRRNLVAATVIPAFALFFGACEVRQTQDGDLPDVNVEGGALPEYDVDPARVNVGTDTQTVIVPDIDITTTDTVRDTIRP